MTRYRIVDQGSLWYEGRMKEPFTIYVKKWWGWKQIKQWFNSIEGAEEYITKRRFFRSRYPVVKELKFT